MPNNKAHTAVPFAEVFSPFAHMGDTIYNVFSEIAGAFVSAVRKSRYERRREATANTLRGLSDATLKDIGISRSDISRVAAESSWERMNADMRSYR